MHESLWDAIAKVERRHWWFRGRREVIARVLERALPPGSAVLDIGCGTGFVLERLSHRFAVTGLEPDATVRDRAAAPMRDAILEGSSDDLSVLAGNQFDAVTMLDVLEHLDDDIAALRSIRTVLSDNGLLLATVPADPSLWSAHDELNEHRRRYTPESLRRALVDAGYVIEKLAYLNVRLYPLARFHRSHAGDPCRALTVPAAPFNSLFAWLFANEQPAGLARKGLSLLAVARPGNDS
jgi:SAM-dependent methyltransferase